MAEPGGVDKSETGAPHEPLHHPDNAAIASQLNTLFVTRDEYPLESSTPYTPEEKALVDKGIELEFEHDTKPWLMIQRLSSREFQPHNTRNYTASLPDTFNLPLFELNRILDQTDEEVLNIRIITKNGSYPPFVKGSDETIYSFDESFILDDKGIGARVVSAATFPYWEHVQQGDPIPFTPDELIEVPFIPDVGNEEIHPISDEERARIQEDLQDIRSGKYNRVV